MSPSSVGSTLRLDICLLLSLIGIKNTYTHFLDPFDEALTKKYQSVCPSHMNQLYQAPQAFRHFICSILFKFCVQKLIIQFNVSVGIWACKVYVMDVVLFLVRRGST